MAELTPEHREFLSSQAVNVELAEKLGVRSLVTRADNPQEGVWENFANHPAILFPWTGPDGRVEYQVRPDKPTQDHRGRDRKYVFRKDMTPVLWAIRPIDDGTETFLIVEGTKQALAAASYAPEGVAVYGISGCRSWQKDGEPIPDLAEALGYDVVVCLDADASHNYKVYDAGVALKKALKEAGAASVAFTWLDASSDAKAGLDDVLGELGEADRAGYLADAIEGAQPDPAARNPKGEEASEEDELAAMLDGTESTEDDSPWLDLGPYLDGNYSPPEPEIGARRSDGRALLYPGKCHFLVATTGVGKSWFALVHVAAELLAGNTVVYGHFEEPLPGDTLARLGRLGVPVDVLRSGLKWLDVDKAKTYRKGLAALEQAPALVILDGVVAACTGKPINDDETVNWFRAKFVTPAAKLGAAVLALHHPVKDPGRRGELGGRGSGSWINLVDGVHFQGIPGKKAVSRGRKGSLDIYADKDRAGSVVQGAPDGPHNWRSVATLWVEDVDDKVETSLEAPLAVQEGTDGPEAPDKVTELAEAILWVLKDFEESHRYETQGALEDMLRGRRIAVQKKILGAALVHLEDRGLIERAPANGNQARPGWLTEAALSGSGGAGTTPESPSL